MGERITRRGWMAAVSRSTAAIAGAQEAGAGDSPEELLKQAKDQLQKGFESLHKVKIPAGTEPAFAFRA